MDIKQPQDATIMQMQLDVNMVQPLHDGIIIYSLYSLRDCTPLLAKSQGCERAWAKLVQLQ